MAAFSIAFGLRICYQISNVLDFRMHMCHSLLTNNFWKSVNVEIPLVTNTIHKILPKLCFSNMSQIMCVLFLATTTNRITRFMPSKKMVPWENPYSMRTELCLWTGNQSGLDLHAKIRTGHIRARTHQRAQQYSAALKQILLRIDRAQLLQLLCLLQLQHK